MLEREDQSKREGRKSSRLPPNISLLMSSVSARRPPIQQKGEAAGCSQCSHCRGGGGGGGLLVFECVSGEVLGLINALQKTEINCFLQLLMNHPGVELKAFGPKAPGRSLPSAASASKGSKSNSHLYPNQHVRFEVHPLFEMTRHQLTSGSELNRSCSLVYIFLFFLKKLVASYLRPRALVHVDGVAVVLLEASTPTCSLHFGASDEDRVTNAAVSARSKSNVGISPQKMICRQRTESVMN